MPTYYHVTESENLRSIRKKGLKAKSTLFYGRHLFLWKSRKNALGWAKMRKYAGGKQMAILKVDVPKNYRVHQLNPIEPIFFVSRSVPSNRLKTVKFIGRG